MDTQSMSLMQIRAAGLAALMRELGPMPAWCVSYSNMRQEAAIIPVSAMNGWTDWMRIQLQIRYLSGGRSTGRVRWQRTLREHVLKINIEQIPLFLNNNYCL